MKKYFAMSIIAASVALAACSDDDDDDDVGPGAGVPPIEVPDGTPVATPGEGNTAFDFIADSGDHVTLLGLIEAAELDDLLDDPNSQFTIFAPTEVAFEGMSEEELDAIGASDTLVRLLMNHVVEGSVQSEEINAGVSAAEGGRGSVFTANACDRCASSIAGVHSR